MDAAYLQRRLLHLGHEHEPEKEDNGPIIAVKMVAMVSVFLVSIGFALLSMRLGKRAETPFHLALVSYANCFSGGILIGFAFLHLLPAAVDEFSLYTSDDKTTKLNLMHLTVLCGFFIVLAVEKIIYVKTMRRDENLKGGAMELPQIEDEVPQFLRSKQFVHQTFKEKISPTEEPKQQQHEHHSHAHGFHTHEVPFNTRSKATPIIIAVSLCFHSIFEGLAMGLSRTLHASIVLVIGMVLHKCGEGFAMGTAFAKANTPRKQWLPLVLAFGVVIPIGILIGMALEDLVGATFLISAILNALAAGSFIYVALLGVIVEEFSGVHNLWTKLFTVIGGILVMGIVGCVEVFGA